MNAPAELPRPGRPGYPHVARQRNANTFAESAGGARPRVRGEFRARLRTFGPGRTGAALTSLVHGWRHVLRGLRVGVAPGSAVLWEVRSRSAGCRRGGCCVPSAIGCYAAARSPRGRRGAGRGFQRRQPAVADPHRDRRGVDRHRRARRDPARGRWRKRRRRWWRGGSAARPLPVQIRSHPPSHPKRSR